MSYRPITEKQLLSTSRFKPYPRLLKDVLPDLRVVREGLNDLMAHIHRVDVPLGLEVVECELVTDL